MGKKIYHHHEIPRFYLKGFCEPGQSFVWRFTPGKPFVPGASKSKSNPYRSGLKETALRADGYGIRIPGKPVDFSYERRLQGEEQRADTTLFKIQGLISVDYQDKIRLAHYITLMQKRLAYRDRQFRGMAENIVKSFDWNNLQKELAFQGRFDLALQVPEAKQRFFSEAGITRLLRESMMQPYTNALRELLRMTWTFEVAPHEAYFVTSDNPVIYDEEKGLLTSNLIFPVSKKVTLIAHRSGGVDLAFQQTSSSMLEQINTLIIQRSRIEVYSPRPEEWINDILLRKE